MPRPCPFVSCSHHLYLDVNPASGAIKLNFPHLEVWEMKETCALDVADRGGITLEEVGDILNLTRERIRQVEVRGLGKMRDETEGADELSNPARWAGYEQHPEKFRTSRDGPRRRSRRPMRSSPWLAKPASSGHDVCST